MAAAAEHARLEYLNSQEPGDASQANAIAIVDMLLLEDDTEASQTTTVEPVSATKSVSTLGSKVAQCLAKRADNSYSLEKAGVFDWFDTPNHDGITSNISRVGMTSQLTQLKVDNDERPNGESSISLTNRPSKSKTRKNTKHITGKAKRSIQSGVLRGATNYEVSKVMRGSGADDSNIPCLLGKDAIIHPKRKRTYIITSGSLKVEFNKSTRLTAEKAKTTEVAELPAAKLSSILEHDTIKGIKMIHKSYLATHKAPDATSAVASVRITTTHSKIRGIQKETSDFKQLEGTSSTGLEKQSTSQQKDHGSSLKNRAPLRELNSTEPQSKAQASKMPLKRGLLKSPGSRELAGLFGNEVSPVLPSSRRRKRHMSSVRVLFSQGMDNKTMKDQTKILAHFGLPVATTISEATHFVAEKFARTRNMLEAIAMGIPVVTPSWLECCNEAMCLIDEEKYLMRDTKKEKELQFSMPVSLSQACKSRLLEGKRVLITRNAKPSKELLKILVVAAGGKTLERITVSMMKNKKFEGVFVISCEQDRSICLPFLKNGLGVFDPELLLNGIVVQKLEFERYRLFREKM